MIDVSIIVVTYNSETDIPECLRSLESTKGSLSVEITLVDNHSSDRTVNLIRSEWSKLHLITNELNVGFPAANNLAIPLATGRYILLLNPDTIVLPGALETIVRYMDEHPNCGICGPRLVNMNGVEAPALFEPGILQSISRYGRLKNLQYYFLNKERLVVSGACLAFRRQLVSEVGLLDPQLFWAEDGDFCIRARKVGYEVRNVPGATVIHKGGQSAKSNLQQTLYVQNANYLRMISTHYRSYRRAMLLSVRLIEICLRILKQSLLAAFKLRADARQRLGGLLQVVREMPALLSSRRCGTREKGPSLRVTAAAEAQREERSILVRSER